MFNSQRPSVDDLPTSGQLFRATAVALVAASAILVTVVLPAEYAIDLTGAGRALGFTQMGEVKAQLAEEAAADAIPQVAPTSLVSQTSASADPVDTERRSDVTTLTLAPGEGAEIKAKMAKGASLQFDWSVSGGAVNFDTHGDPPNAPRSFYHGYGKGKNSTGEQGTLVAAFDGKHGWFWRNRSDRPVTITLRTDGIYEEIKRVV
ncbi:MAG: transmembrane anchor protein [Sphingomonadaceae bacterium]|nr:transmembrane anchor protein [Sphingomonadaceae bacterium]